MVHDYQHLTQYGTTLSTTTSTRHTTVRLSPPQPAPDTIRYDSLHHNQHQPHYGTTLSTTTSTCHTTVRLSPPQPARAKAAPHESFISVRLDNWNALTNGILRCIAGLCLMQDCAAQTRHQSVRLRQRTVAPCCLLPKSTLSGCLAPV